MSLEAMTHVDIKAGFSGAEARDALGRWSGGGGGGAIGGHVSKVANHVLVNPSPLAFHFWLHNLLHAPHVPSATIVATAVAGRVLFRAAVIGGLLYAGRRLARQQAHQDVHGVIAGAGKAPEPSKEFVIRVGPQEPHAVRDKKIGVYQDGKPVHPDDVPPQIRKVIGLKSPAAETKTGFDPSEPRDQEGQWTEGGGGGARDERLVWPERVKGVDADGNLHTVHVNPRPAQAASLGQQSDTLNALVLGHNVAVGTATHDDIFHALKKAAHHLVSTYQQRAEAKSPHNRLVLKKQNVSLIDKALGSEKPLPKWQAQYGGYLNQGLVDESHWPRALKVAYGTAAGLAVPGIFRVRTPPLRLSLAPRLRLPSPVIRLSKPMDHTETKFNFQAAQPRDELGRWTGGGNNFDPITHTLKRWGRRIGNRLGQQPLPSGHIPHPHGQIWVNPSSARIVQFHREGNIGSVARSGKNVILSRGIPAEQALDHLVNNRKSIVQTAEPELPYAYPQTVIRGKDSILGRYRKLYVNPSPRNMAAVFKQSKDGRVKTLVIGDNLVVGPNSPDHYDMARILQRSGHPLGQRFYQGSHLPRREKSRRRVAETKAGFSASEGRDDHGRWTGGGRSSGGPFRRRDRPIAPRVRGPNGQEIYAGSDIASAAMQGNRRAMAMPMPASYYSARKGSLLINPHPAVLAGVLEHFDRVGVKPKVDAYGDNLVVQFGKVSAKDVRANGVQSLREATIPARAQALIQHERGSIIVNPHPTDIARMLHSTGGHIHLIHSGGHMIVAGSNIARDEVLSSVAAKGGHFRSIAEHATKSADDLGEVEMPNLTDDAADLPEMKHLLAQIPNVTSAPCELKFVGDPAEGLIEGYASIYGNVDQHGDVVDRGAFDISLKEFTEHGKPILMYGEHSPYKQGGDPYPVGKWESVESDEKGLRVKGRLLALDHPDVKRVHTLIKEGALPGISIAYNVNPGGAELGRKASEPKRRLKSVHLVSIDLTANPSNPLALIDGFKAVSAMQTMMAGSAEADDDLGGGDPDEAIDTLEDAMQACQDMIDGDRPPDLEDLTGLMERLHDCHDVLTGNAPHMVEVDHRDAADMPEGEGVKSITFTKRRLERRLREEPIAGKRLSQRDARDFVDRVFEDGPRDEADMPEQKAEEEAVTSLSATLAGFSLSFEGK